MLQVVHCINSALDTYTLTSKGQFQGIQLKMLLWTAAKATTVAEFETCMGKIQSISEGAFKWLENKPASQWSRSHFKETTKCDMLLNNMCESFNATILQARDKPSGMLTGEDTLLSHDVNGN
ncbi:Uncharacterized protein Adt_28964 [Abeliophyllum distichum]|uniref:Pectinesterase inhibitor domain-containing protein n=1 Tax=Abeliophyllum distichum TaxID=126358 RepID=A0ABD1RYS0_9LAMI